MNFHDDTSFYLMTAHNSPELTREHEAELARRSKQGDRRAANALARSYQRHVVALAFKYRRYGIPVSELVAEGNVGVVQALAKFEPERGTRFATYAAFWVKAQMLAHIVKAHSAVGGSDGPLRSQLFFKLRRERARVFNQLGPGEAAEQVLAERLGVSIDRLRRLLQRLDNRDVSLDLSDRAEAPGLRDRLAASDDQEQELLQRQLGGCLRGALERAFERLDPRERRIIERRLMAEPHEALSLAALARTLGISRERARQLEARALNKLRRSLSSEEHPVLSEWLADQRRASAA